MLLIPCPHCGPRAEIEFRYGGEAHVVRPLDPSGHDDAAWAAHLYHRGNPLGEHAERWRHAHGCGRFFNAVRHTKTDVIVATYPAGSPRPTPGDTGPEQRAYAATPPSEGAL